MWNVPNVLTLIRLALVPVFAFLYLEGHPMWALFVFLLASLTDAIDGNIARRYNLITPFGKLMDPLADKIMVLTTLVLQWRSGVVPTIAILIVAIKEGLMFLGGAFLLGRGRVVHSMLPGKAAQCSFIAALFLGFFHQQFLQLGVPVDSIMLWISVGLAIIALVQYIIVFLYPEKPTKNIRST